MTFAVGIFELLTYTIPGSLYVAFFAYVATRSHWVNPAVVGQAPSVLLVIVTVLVSYLLGYLAYPLGATTNRLVPDTRDRRPRESFVRRVPAATNRAYVQADSFLLLSAVQVHDKDVAIEITRLRAAGLMLRNCAPPLLLGFVAAIVELVAGSNPALVVTSAALFGSAFFAVIVQGRRLAHWATMKTLELCFWIPGIDETFGGPEGDNPASSWG